ncbi:helix-turn-helix domain-containing protein [Glycomyces albidus]|nr:helix-turn-helix transcriptional regulator [Glycomyces albidus]
MVYQRRHELGLSQVELADRAGMTQPQLSRLEGGGVTPTIPLLERLAAALDVDLVIDFAPRMAA